MAKRKDGVEKKAQILESATVIFAEKGYRDTTIAAICKLAGANVASVNYYFGSKEDLYANVWRNAFDTAMKIHPIDRGFDEDLAPEDQLRAMVKGLLSHMLDTGSLGDVGQILVMEMFNPTEAIHMIKKDAITPLREQTHLIIRKLLGEEATEQDVVFCAMSMMHQCFGFGMRRGKLPPVLQSMDRVELFYGLVDHITIFTLAGIECIKKNIRKGVK